MKSMTLMWIGSILIGFSIVLQAAGLLLSPLAFALTMSGLLLNGISVPFTIRQAYKSALEQQQLIEQERKRNEAVAEDKASNASEYRLLRALNAAPETMPTKEN